jgi:hypothetical protein
MSDELLVTVQMRFPSLDRKALAEHLAPVMTTAVAAGGVSTSVSIQAYDPDDEPSA